MSEWISVKDGLPKEQQFVLIYNTELIGGNASVSWLKDGKWYLLECSTHNDPIYEPTHWMPLPEPPNQ